MYLAFERGQSSWEAEALIAQVSGYLRVSPGESGVFADRGNSELLPYSVHRPKRFHKHSSLFKMKMVKKFFSY